MLGITEQHSLSSVHNAVVTCISNLSGSLLCTVYTHTNIYKVLSLMHETTVAVLLDRMYMISAQVGLVVHRQVQLLVKLVTILSGHNTV